MPVTVAQCLRDSGLARIDAEILMMHALQVNRSYLYAHTDEEIDDQLFQVYCQRRNQGEPIAYIIGKKAFYHHDFIVSPDVLIPRPETEMLVEKVLTHFAERKSLQLADLGTGSGVIALSIAAQQPNWRVIATDQSEAALQCARANAKQLGITNVSFVQGGWCEALPRMLFDVIVANPPYINDCDVHLQQGDVRFEPRSALVADEQGLADIKMIVQQAKCFLQPGGMLLLEHGYDQGRAVRELLQKAGYNGPLTLPDLAGLDRMTFAVFN